MVRIKDLISQLEKILEKNPEAHVLISVPESHLDRICQGTDITWYDIETDINEELTHDTPPELVLLFLGKAVMI
jgi:hypothetical protein